VLQIIPCVTLPLVSYIIDYQLLHPVSMHTSLHVYIQYDNLY